ncbi:MAG TPA: hypothetical protein VFN68_10375 [Acidimicrobiales bacterium]|nr:hypothetical protein [Acidimicrobiales bacterium]
MSGPIDGAEPEAPPVDDRDEEAGGADEVTTDGVATDGVTTDEVTADEAFLSAVAAEFDAIEAALVRLDDGTFDSCQVCGGRIGQDRLMADPLLTGCPSHT